MQIRFDSSDDKDLISYSEAELAGYLLNNRQYFSEWSSITLLKPILKPEITIEQLDREEGPLIYRGNFHITGSIEFKAPSIDLDGVSYPEEERLQVYRIRVTYDNDDNNEEDEIEVFDSG